MNNIQQKSLGTNSEETNGFDIQAGLSWIYPTNYPLRDYQFNIIQQALYKNTLVCLPTGLGKTFIAAVVMYNFYRWYPTGKIVFMAPTRPLVKQQIDACYDIMAIPKDVTAELTGTKQNITRNEVWMEKRVFFVTPQVLQNDLDSIADLCMSIKCLVFDEAHRARGNYAYCEVMRRLQRKSRFFRVLALSATPGNSIDDVGEVINTLAISHMEFRTEESEDVNPYVFQRKLETIVVALDEKLEQIKDDYLQILEKYARTLIKHKIIQGNCSTLTKGRIFMAKKEFAGQTNRHPNYNEVMKTLNICMTLYHAYELLIRHGLRGFLSFYEEHADKPLIRGNTSLLRVIDDVRDYLGPLPNIDPLPDGTYPEIPKTVKFGHPKFYKLRDILLSHFETNENNSRVIVFFEYRDSVMEAFLVLLQARPVIQAKIFLGQKSGITQRVQLNVIKAFREGTCNTLLSTSIGEEGLDVGEVDLIVCFDISNKSPIRMVQRMGRTGRKREGRVVVLVTQGKEQQTLNDCLYQKNNMKNWAGSTEIMQRFFVKSPRMVPENIMPECVKMQISVRRPEINKKKNLKEMLKSLTGESSSIIPEDTEIIEIKERIPECVSWFNKPLSFIKRWELKPNFDKHMEKQRVIQGNNKIKASSDTEMLVDLLKYADSKRFNIPLTQDGKLSNKNLKQGDIRSMFTKVNTLSQADFMTQKTLTSQIPTQSEANSEESYKELYIEIANFLSIELTSSKKCEICTKLFECDVGFNTNEDFMVALKHWEPPVFNFEEITLNTLEMYEKSLFEKENNVDDSILQLIDAKDLSDLFGDKIVEKSFKFDPPKSFNKLLNSFNMKENDEIIDKRDTLEDLLKFFKLDEIEDIFEDTKRVDLDETIIYSNPQSPVYNFEDHPLSPVLSTQGQRQQVSRIEEPGSPVLKVKNLTQRRRNRAEKSFILNETREKNLSGSKILEKSIIRGEKMDSGVKRGENIHGGNVLEKSMVLDEETGVGIKERGNSQGKKVLGSSMILDEEDGSRREERRTLRGGKDLDKGTGNEIKERGNLQGRKVVEKSMILDKERGNIQGRKVLEKSMILDRETGCKMEERGNLQGRRFLENSIIPDKETFSRREEKGNLQARKVLEESMILDKETGSRMGENLGKSVIPDKRNDSESSELEDMFGSNILEKSIIVDQKIGSEMKRKENSPDILEKSMILNGRKKSGTSQEELIFNGDKIRKTFDEKSQDGKPVGKSMIFNESKDSETSEEENLLGIYGRRKKRKRTEPLEIDDIFDLSAFGLAQKTQEKSQKSQDLEIDDLCDISMLFGAESTDIEEKNDGANFGSSPKENANTDMATFDSTREEINNLDFNNFKKHLSTDFMSTQKELTEKKSKESPNENVIDLTNSPEKTQKRKIMSQMSITQILSLAAKPTQNTSSFKPPSSITIRKKPMNKSVIKTSNIKNNPKKKTVPVPSCSVNIIDDSDDEFEDTSNITKSFNKTIRNLKDNCNLQNPKAGLLKKQKEKKKRDQCEFIDYEAEVSIDENPISSDENCEDGPFDQSFVNDESQFGGNDTQMHVKYLQSIKSPRIPKFKIPAIIKPITADIFSQPQNNEELNSYINDSFCVNTQDVDNESHELSELDILEKKLKEMRKNKRKRTDNKNKENKRKRIISIESDSD